MTKIIFLCCCLLFSNIVLANSNCEARLGWNAPLPIASAQAQLETIPQNKKLRVRVVFWKTSTDPKHIVFFGSESLASTIQTNYPDVQMLSRRMAGDHSQFEVVFSGAKKSMVSILEYFKIGDLDHDLVLAAAVMEAALD
jgi:hypothetical protein